MKSAPQNSNRGRNAIPYHIYEKISKKKIKYWGTVIDMMKKAIEDFSKTYANKEHR